MSMGAQQSYISSESISAGITWILIIGLVGVYCFRVGSSGSHDQKKSGFAVKKGKSKKQNEGDVIPASPRTTSQAVSSPVMPGQLHVDRDQDYLAFQPVNRKAKKVRNKRNKDKEVVAKKLSVDSDESTTIDVTPSPEIRSSGASHVTPISPDINNSWTQVGSKHIQKSRTPITPSDKSQNESSIQKGVSSPVRNAADGLPNSQNANVDEDPDRGQNQKLDDFSRADNEDDLATTENDADGEDGEDGWAVVSSKRSKRSNVSSTSGSFKAAEILTKKQRQNAEKRSQRKAAAAEAEAQRLLILAEHKRELEKARMEEANRKVRGSKATKST